MKYKPFENLDVAAVFDSAPPKLRRSMMNLRQLVFDTAEKIEEVGEIEEALRWGQPSYLTTKSKSGTAIRIDKIKDEPGKYALYVHCQTSLIENFKEKHNKKFIFEGTRAIHFDENEKIAEKELQEFISMALTYKIDWKRK